MMPPFVIHFRPSYWRHRVIVVFTLVLLGNIVFYFSGSLQWILLVVACLAACWAWREPVPYVQTVSVNNKGHATLYIDGMAYEAQLLSGSLIHHFVCCIKWQLPEKIIWQWVFPDATDSESLRRLRVWAWFGQPQYEENE